MEAELSCVPAAAWADGCPGQPGPGAVRASKTARKACPPRGTRPPRQRNRRLRGHLTDSGQQAWPQQTTHTPRHMPLQEGQMVPGGTGLFWAEMGKVSVLYQGTDETYEDAGGQSRLQDAPRLG